MNTKEFLLVSLLITSALFSGCGRKKIRVEDFQLRQGVAYQVNSEKPFTGLVEKKGNSDQFANVQDFVISYSDGLLDGECTFFYKNQQKSEEMHFIKGQMSGKYTSWDMNGEKQAELIVDPKLDYQRIKEPFNSEVIFLSNPFLPLENVLASLNNLNNTAEFQKKFGIPTKTEYNSWCFKYIEIFTSNNILMFVIKKDDGWQFEYMYGTDDRLNYEYILQGILKEKGFTETNAFARIFTKTINKDKNIVAQIYALDMTRFPKRVCWVLDIKQ